jgi:hypothetical protein
MAGLARRLMGGNGSIPRNSRLLMSEHLNLKNTLGKTI